MLSVRDYNLGLVIPAFNEEARILPTLERLTQELDSGCGRCTITVVDDGSTDGTREVCQDFAAQHPDVRVISYAENRGKGFAVKTGMLLTDARLIAFSDADMPVPPQNFGQFVAALNSGHDLAIGSRYLPKARWEMPLSRRVAGWAFRWLVRMIANSRVSDTQFGFKMFTGPVAHDLFSALTTDGYTFDAELLRLAHQRHYRIAELPVRGINAPGSKVRPVHDGLLMLWQLLQMRSEAAAPWAAPRRAAQPALPPGMEEPAPVLSVSAESRR